MSFTVTTFDVETVDDVLFLCGFQEFGFIGEIDQEKRGDQANGDSDDTFENEDPSPSSISPLTVHF